MPGTMHRSPSTGTATRSVPTAALTAAIQPSRSTTAAGPGTPRRSGAATARSASRPASRCRHRSTSASRTAMPTSATAAGCTVAAGPEMSTIPSNAPVRGSCTGAAAHVHGCRLRW